MLTEGLALQVGAVGCSSCGSELWVRGVGRGWCYWLESLVGLLDWIELLIRVVGGSCWLGFRIGVLGWSCWKGQWF